MHPIFLLFTKITPWSRSQQSPREFGFISKQLKTGLSQNWPLLQTGTGFVLFRVLQILWLFPWPFLVFHDLRFSCHFWKFQNFTSFSTFFDLKQFYRNKLWYPPKCVPFVLLNLITPLYLTFSLLCHLQWLIYQNKTLIFHDFPGLEKEILKFHDFPGFSWPVGTLR